VIDPYAHFRLNCAVNYKCLVRQTDLTQDMFMPKRLILGLGLTVVILGILLLVTGWYTGSFSTTSEEYQGERENVESVDQVPADDGIDANAGAQSAPQQTIISERLPYGEIGDQLVYGHFVFPADMVEPLPAVIVIHDWWGLNDSVRAMADRLAAEGYIVLAVDLYAGETATTSGAAGQYLLRVVEHPETVQENIRKAYEFLSDTAGAPHIGSLGWGLGGGWSLNAALLFPNDLDAAVVYYGQISSDEEELRTLDVPLLGHFGGADEGISVASVRNFEAALEHLRKDYDIQVYPGAKHRFADPTDDSYNAQAAEDAWEKTLEFFGQNLIAPVSALAEPEVPSPQ
jgi:carboxymethylenebutenolidase